MEFSYKTKGVCARGIIIDVDGDTVKSVKFDGGCSGNTQGVARLAEGMTVDMVIEKLRVIHCGRKPTSCPDQLALALQQMKEEQ